MPHLPKELLRCNTPVLPRAATILVDLSANKPHSHLVLPDIAKYTIMSDHIPARPQIAKKGIVQFPYLSST